MRPRKAIERKSITRSFVGRGKHAGIQLTNKAAMEVAIKAAARLDRVCRAGQDDSADNSLDHYAATVGKLER